MRVFSVPSSYADEIEAAVSRAVDLIRRDEDRRAKGEIPIVPDFVYDSKRKGEMVVIVGIDSDRLLSVAEHHALRASRQNGGTK